MTTAVLRSTRVIARCSRGDLNSWTRKKRMGKFACAPAQTPWSRGCAACADTRHKTSIQRSMQNPPQCILSVPFRIDTAVSRSVLPCRMPQRRFRCSWSEPAVNPTVDDRQNTGKGTPRRRHVALTPQGVLHAIGYELGSVDVRVFRFVCYRKEEMERRRFEFR